MRKEYFDGGLTIEPPTLIKNLVLAILRIFAIALLFGICFGYAKEAALITLLLEVRDFLRGVITLDA